MKVCNTDPKKHLEIHLGTDSLFIDADIGSGGIVQNTFTNGEIVTELHNDALETTVLGSWTRMNSCFQAAGGEEHLAITMPTGFFEVISSCTVSNELGTFHWFYFDLDAVTLEALPASYSQSITICSSEPTEVDLRSLFTIPIDLNGTFNWSDGFNGPMREIDQSGMYSISFQLECGSIPMQLEVAEIDCQGNAYVPNVFSPNFDGINDSFKPFIDSELPFNYYRFQVFDRWGNLLFSTTDQNAAWDGRSNGSLLGTGTYVWLMEFESAKGTTEKEVQSGSILLLR